MLERPTQQELKGASGQQPARAKACQQTPSEPGTDTAPVEPTVALADTLIAAGSGFLTHRNQRTINVLL
jgi:hypothetical protein